jgi:membrane fusion protein, multidrug efflux system
MSPDTRLTSRSVSRNRLIVIALVSLVCAAGATIYLSQSKGEFQRTPGGRTGQEGEQNRRQARDARQPGSAGTPVNVQVAIPTRRDLTYSITLPATLAPFYQTTLYAKVSGYLKWIGPDKGDWVRKDDLVAIIDAPEVEEQYQQAVADYRIKKITFERLNKVWKESPEVIAKQDVDVAEAAYESSKNLMQQRAVLRDYTKVRAPFSGVITARFADPGALIQVATSSLTNAMPLLTLMDLEVIRVYTNVPQEEAAFIKSNVTEAILSVTERSADVFRGTVTRTTFALDPSTRSLLVEIDLPNNDHLLQPGMFGEVTLVLLQRPAALVIPPGSIITKNGATTVFVLENEAAKQVQIRTGITDGRWVEVTEGLTGMEEVVVVGKGKLTEGIHVEASPYNLPEGTAAVQKFERRAPPVPERGNGAMKKERY